MLVVPQTGNVACLSIIRTEWVTNPPRCHLYQNDYSPTLASVLGDFVESTFPGYAAVPLTFSLPVIDATDHAVIEADPLIFKCTEDPGAGERPYGLYVTDATGLVLLWAERFERRVFVRLDGQQFTLVVKFGALSEFTG